MSFFSKKKYSNLYKIVFLLFFIASFSCSKEETYDKKNAVLAFLVKNKITIAKSLEDKEVQIPKQKSTNFYPGSNYLVNSDIENFELDVCYKEKGFFKKKTEIDFDEKSVYWSFYLSKKRENFAFEPVFDGNDLYILNSRGSLIKKDLKKNKVIYKKRLFKSVFLKNYRTPKISLNNNKIFAISGSNLIIALDKNSGEIIWQKSISSLPISRSISDETSLFVITNDNKTYSLDVHDGSLNWVHSGIILPTAIFGSADPVISDDVIFSSYSSGEIYAINKKDGEPVWSQDLNINKAINSNFYLNDIDATPIVKNNIIYAIGNGGLMMAIDKESGNYIWKKNISSIVNFWISGNFIYVITNENKLLAIHKKDGLIKWITNLFNEDKKDKKEDKIIYSGVVMAGSKLLISSFNNGILIIDPKNGEIEKRIKISGRVSHPPVVFDKKIYLNIIHKYTNALIELK